MSDTLEEHATFPLAAHTTIPALQYTALLDLICHIRFRVSRPLQIACGVGHEHCGESHKIVPK
jgi:hypothetical protein